MTQDQIKSDLLAAIEATAVATGLRPSTVCARVGMGGKGYKRLHDPARRFWPETAEVVKARLKELEARIIAGAAE